MMKSRRKEMTIGEKEGEIEGELKIEGVSQQNGKNVLPNEFRDCGRCRECVLPLPESKTLLQLFRNDNTIYLE